MELRKKLLSVAALAFAATLSTGVAVAASAQDDANWSDFEISATAIRTEDPAGLRFKVDCPVDYSEDSTVNAYTILRLTTSENETYTKKVHAQVWRKDNTGWNTVLTHIPATDYVTEVYAQAFVVLENGTTYETDEIHANIAQTAAKAIATGKATEEAVGHYVSLEEITLDKESAIIDGETLQLTATTSPADYAVKFTSSDESVATVDANGVVTGVGGGRATITASMGGQEASCDVLVTGAGIIKDYDDQTYITGYTTAGNGRAIQSFYGSTLSGSTVATGYSGQQMNARTIEQKFYDDSATDKSMTFCFADTSNNLWKVGFAIAWLDDVFADKHVSALQFDMRLGRGTGITTDVEQSWVAEFVIDSTYRTLTMTREDYYAIKAADSLEVDGFLTITLGRGATYGGAVWWMFDDIKAVYSAEEAEEPEIEYPILSFDFNSSHLIPGYTTVGNGNAIQSYYGGKGSGSTQTAGYSGLTTTQKILFQTAGGVTGNALAFNFAWECRDVADDWKVGFSIAWLDAMFANKTVTAIQWSMKMGNTSGITGIATDVEQSWTDDFVADNAWHTLTMTRADYEAIKAANDLTVDGFLSISATKSGVTYSAAFWWLFDDFTAITA